MLNFIENFLSRIDLRVVSIMKRKSVISLILRVGLNLLKLVGTNKKFDHNYIRGNNEQDTNKSVRVAMVGGSAYRGSWAGSGGFNSDWTWSNFRSPVGFFTTVKLD